MSAAFLSYLSPTHPSLLPSSLSPCACPYLSVSLALSATFRPIHHPSLFFSLLFLSSLTLFNSLSSFNWVLPCLKTTSVFFHTLFLLSVNSLTLLPHNCFHGLLTNCCWIDFWRYRDWMWSLPFKKKQSNITHKECVLLMKNRYSLCLMRDFKHNTELD